MILQKVSSWGRLNQSFHKVHDLDRNIGLLTKSLHEKPMGICYGMGRSYGDVCLNPQGYLWNTRRLDNFIAFDETNGHLICESGVLLRDIQRLFIPRGWCLPVTPGTQMVTVGGAIANDIHGKNYHRFASFGNHVRSINLMRTDGQNIVCGPSVHPDWFSATVGGLGLTGVILTAEIQLTPIPGPWLETELSPFECLNDFFKLANSSEAQWEHTVSLIDCLGLNHHRGVFLRAKAIKQQNNPFGIEISKKPIGNPAPNPKTLFFVPPFSLVNTCSLKVFNQAYFAINKRKRGKGVSYYEDFFYPLDKLLKWNRIYGPKGFYQYQLVVPSEVGKDAISALLKEISRSKEGSFLSVLKTFSQKQSLGMLSFPQEGVTLALDFPNRGQSTLDLFKRLDAIVVAAKGRLYLAKDARMPRELFESMYPRYQEFLAYRDPGISSAMSRRLMGY